MSARDDAKSALDTLETAAEVASIMVELTIIEIETRGRVPAEECRKAREELARAYTLACKPSALRTAMREAHNAIETRGGCYACTDDRLCDPCLDGREAAGLT